MGMNYYLTNKPCETCGHVSERKHIGKSSHGWSFHFRAHPVEITCYRDWLRELENPRYLIRDEEGEIISLNDFIDKVESKKEGLNHARIFQGIPMTKREHEYLREYPLRYPSDSGKRSYVDEDGHAFTDWEFS